MHTIVGIILFLVTTAMAGDEHKDFTHWEGHEGLCYTTDSLFLFPVGTTIYDAKNCYALTCSKKPNDSRYTVERRMCGSVGTRSPCVFEKEFGPYPDCCTRVKCPSGTKPSDFGFNPYPVKWTWVRDEKGEEVMKCIENCE